MDKAYIQPGRDFEVQSRTPIVHEREPDLETLMEWEAESGCEATDGCWVESDGTCPHGHKSWLLELGYI